MNFTREPIIETIITPKEGYKLVVRNSKGGSLEEYSVDAVEVVSFGHSFFYRSLERPKAFLLPVSDYEVIESKETRVVLKNVPLERSIKIGGGKTKSIADEASEENAVEEKPKRKKALRRRKNFENKEESKTESLSPQNESSETSSCKEKEKSSKKAAEPQVSSTMFKNLFPPPSSLIKRENLAFPEGSHDQKKEVLKEDNMDQPDLIEPSLPQDESDKSKDDPSSSSDEARQPIYHEASTETEDNKNHSDEEKTKKSHQEKSDEKDSSEPVEKTTLPFKPENNFAY